MTNKQTQENLESDFLKTSFRETNTALLSRNFVYVMYFAACIF